ncbi:FYN-binding 2 isoform X1 [Solea senegalensis]|uniref:FYN-binding 2 isoform X1 n=1 Tax=Solea senegalensis TaxID=28829 RepID=A0AAV6S8Y9_SOLSE|nr:FYN-binding 2 isoform X1 [Solea senegalensis]
MDQEDTMDFKALRAKFQDEELLLKQPKIKPALPDKPKVVPPPQSPTHYLPAGARPSLLTSINQSLEAKTQLAPRVVFKDEKESKKTLFQNNFKKPKSEGKLKMVKDKTKGSREKLDEDSSEQKQKKENGKDKKLPLLPLKQKEHTAELVPAIAPPKSTTQKKKSILGFRRSLKRNSMEVPPDPILDSPSLDFAGAAPLIPVPSGFDDTPPDPEISAHEDLSASLETTTPSIIPPSTDFFPPPAFIPDYPTPECETPVEIETPALSISRPASQTETVPAASVKTTTPSPSPPEHEVLAETVAEAVNIAAVETPPPPPTIATPSIPPSPKASLLSALERAEDMNPGKRPSADQRIFSALEKARKKSTSPSSNHISLYSITPPPEELPPSESPTLSLPFLPPIDYEGNAHPPKLGQLNGIDHRQASPVLNSITEEGSDLVPEMLAVPPPPPKKVLPDPKTLGPAPEKPDRPPFVNLSNFIPPPVEDNAVIRVPVALSETDTTEFDDVGSTDMPVSEWGNGHYTGPDSVDSQLYSNGTTGDEYQMNPQPLAALEDAEASNGVFVSAENAYDGVSATKKKGKSDSGKKRRGPPKNPYAEAATPTNEEKSKTGRFGKSEKKVVAEGPDEKELKKREKQRLEKEKKELKEKQEREKKEQKEREKKETEMKKKFKTTGQEDAMYQATVTVTTKGRKNDLPVNSGDIISIIRTTNCPRGKWLARDNSNNYGYVAVDHVELDIKEMLELGKKAATTRNTSNTVVEGEVTSTGSRASNHYPLSTESFTDDSEEWTGDDDENLSPAADTADPFSSVSHSRTLSMPDMGNKDLSINHQHSHSDIGADGSQPQARHEALHKLTTFFYSPKHVAPAASNSGVETTPVHAKDDTHHLPDISETQSSNYHETSTTKSSQTEDTGFIFVFMP